MTSNWEALTSGLTILRTVPIQRAATSRSQVALPATHSRTSGWERPIINQSNSTYHHLHQYDPALFAQDDWQITKRLNLNLGVRWEVFSPYTGDPGLGTFAPYVGSTVMPTAPLGLLYQGDPDVPPGVFNTPYKDLAPRVGFALDARGDAVPVFAAALVSSFSRLHRPARRHCSRHTISLLRRTRRRAWSARTVL